MANGNLHDEAAKILQETKDVVWPVIRSNLQDPDYPEQFRVPSEYKDLHKFHWDLVSDYPERQGKYIRPTLILLIAQALGVEKEKAVQTAAGMQLSEEWILVSDDMEDDSPLRRGKPSLHKIHGKELAINASDTLQSIMWKVIFDNKKIVSDQIFEKIYTEFVRMMLRTELGQTFDIYWVQNNKKDYSEKDWMFMAHSKSGYYSIAGPIRLGGILAEVTPEQLNLLTNFGKALGTAWQLIDDILDVTGDFNGKKQYANDVYEGKQTIMFAHLLQKLSKEDMEKLFSIYSKKREGKNEEDIKWVIKKMNEMGSINHARNLTQKYKTEALGILSSINFFKNPKAIEELKTIVNFIVEREY